MQKSIRQIAYGFFVFKRNVFRKLRSTAASACHAVRGNDAYRQQKREAL